VGGSLCSHSLDSTLTVCSLIRRYFRHRLGWLVLHLNACTGKQAIVRMLRAKKQLWLAAKKSGDFGKFKMLSRSARSAIRQHRRNEEQRLIYSKDRKAFFTFVNNKCGSQTQPINLLKNGATLTDYEVAEHFQREFCNNFSAAACKPSTFTCPNASTARAQFPLLNSSETLILDAIRNCSNFQH
jgi:hypothetical protein